MFFSVGFLTLKKAPDSLVLLEELCFFSLLYTPWLVGWLVFGGEKLCGYIYIYTVQGLELHSRKLTFSPLKMEDC